MDIVGLAFRLADTVALFAGSARRFYYSVVLMGRSCPECEGRLAMEAAGVCRCVQCGRELDPTITSKLYFRAISTALPIITWAPASASSIISS